MKQVKLSAFLEHGAALLDEVEGGETLVITRLGKPVAEVRPVEPPVAQEPAWKRPRQLLHIDGVTLSDLISAERDEREAAVCGL